MLHVALDVHLRLLAVGRGGQGHQAENARADALGDGLDGAAFAGGVAPFKDNDHAQALVLDPLLELAKLALELAQFLQVFLVLYFLFPVGFCILAHRLNSLRWRPASLPSCSHGFRFFGLLETAAQGQVQVHALGQLFALHAQQRQPGGMNVELLLLHGAQVAAARPDSWCCASASARSLSARTWLQHPFAIRQGLTGGQGVLDIAQRAQRHAGVLGHGFLLLQRADFDLGLQRAALVDRRDELGAGAAGGILEVVLQLQNIAVDGGDIGVEDEPRQLRRLGFADAVEGGGDAAFGGDHVRPALEHLERQPARERARQGCEALARGQFRGRVTAQQQFQRAQRLLVGEAHLPGGVLEVAQAGAGQRDILFAAGTDLAAVRSARFTSSCAALTMSSAIWRCSHVSLAVNQLLAMVAASDWRLNSKSACAEAWVACAALRP